MSSVSSFTPMKQDENEKRYQITALPLSKPVLGVQVHMAGGTSLSLETVSF